MLNILIDYYNHIIKTITSILLLDIKYLLIITILYLIFHIIISYTVDQIYKSLKKETSIALWIPFINIYYIGKQIHSLYGTIMILETLLLISYPYKVNGIWTISRLCSNKTSNIIFICLILEIPLSIVILLYKYLKYENRIRIIK